MKRGQRRPMMSADGLDYKLDDWPRSTEKENLNLQENGGEGGVTCEQHAISQ